MHNFWLYTCTLVYKNLHVTITNIHVILFTKILKLNLTEEHIKFSKSTNTKQKIGTKATTERHYTIASLTNVMPSVKTLQPWQPCIPCDDDAMPSVHFQLLRCGCVEPCKFMIDVTWSQQWSIKQSKAPTMIRCKLSQTLEFVSSIDSHTSKL